MPEKESKKKAQKSTEKENPRESEDRKEIPQEDWDNFDEAMDKILKVKRPPNQQAG